MYDNLNRSEAEKAEEPLSPATAAGADAAGASEQQQLMERSLSGNEGDAATALLRLQVGGGATWFGRGEGVFFFFFFFLGSGLRQGLSDTIC